MSGISSSGWQMSPKRHRMYYNSLPGIPSLSHNETGRVFRNIRKMKYNFMLRSSATSLDCDSYESNYKFQKGMGPGDLAEISQNRSKSTWLTEPWQIHIFTEVVPLLAGILVFTFFLMVALVLVYGLIRHCYLDHVLPAIFFTLKPLRKDKLKVIYLKYPNEVAFKNLSYYKWNPIRKCYRRHSICQLHHTHRNHRKLSDHEKPNDKLALLKIIKAESQARSLSNANLDVKVKPTVAHAPNFHQAKRKSKDIEPRDLEQSVRNENETLKLQISKQDKKESSKRKQSIQDKGDTDTAIQSKPAEGISKQEIIPQQSSFHYQQQQIPKPDIMSIQDITVSIVGIANKRRTKRRKTVPKVTLPKVVRKFPNLTSDSEDKAEPELPISNTNKKRKSSTPDPNLEKSKTSDSNENPNDEHIGKKLIRRKKSSVPANSAANQGNVQMKVVRRRRLSSKKRYSKENTDKDKVNK